MANFLLISLYIGFLSASTSFPNLTISESVRAIYHQNKDKILSFVRYEYNSFNVHIVTGTYCPTLWNSFHALYDLGRKDLLKAILCDPSDDLLASMLFSYKDYREYLIFNDIASLRVAEIRLRTRVYTKIFDMFKRFLLESILNSKPKNWTNSNDSQQGFTLLELFRVLWYTRISPLGRKLVNSESREKMEQLLVENFTFYEIFLAHRTEDLLVLEHFKLRSDANEIIIKITSAVRSFSFLANHFRIQLGSDEDDEYISMLRWLANQSPRFLVDFFGFLTCLHIDSLTTGSMGEMVIYYFNLSNGGLMIFGKSVSKRHENYMELRSIAKRIILKTKKVYGRQAQSKSFVIYEI
jgi:hypothetical protein